MNEYLCAAYVQMHLFTFLVSTFWELEKKKKKGETERSSTTKFELTYFLLWEEIDRKKIIKIDRNYEVHNFDGKRSKSRRLKKMTKIDEIEFHES